MGPLEDEHEGSDEDEAEGEDGDRVDGHAFKEIESEEGGGEAANAGEEGVDGHVIGDPVRRGDLGDPQAPGHIATGVGHAEKESTKGKARPGTSGEERGNAEEKSEIEVNAKGEEFDPVEETTPEKAEDEATDIGQNTKEEGDGGDGKLEAVDGVGEVFDAEGEHHEVAEAHEHPGGDHPAEEPVFLQVAKGAERVATADKGDGA